MYSRRHKPTFAIRHTPWRDCLRSGVCVLALGASLGLSFPLAAQENPVVDITDPNVSVDLSVLNDGGLSPQIGAPTPGTVAATLPGGAVYQAPGKDMPVSTLYIKPTSGFKLPPQTKSIAPKSAKAVTQPPIAAPEPVEDSAPVEVAVAPAPTVQSPDIQSPDIQSPGAEPATPEPVVAAEQAPLAPPPPEPAKLEPAREVAALTPPAPAIVPEATSEPTPAQTPAQTQAPHSQPMALKAEPAVEAAPPPPAAEVLTPVPAPTQPPKQTVAVAAPPPPPAPIERDETDTAPLASKSGGVVIPLPPKAGEQPAEVASLPPATGPLSDGDSLRIVFDAETSKLAPSARDALLDMATKMRNQSNLRLQLLAYAGGTDASASAARRLSLSRALAVRSFLIENGVRSTRIDVRALGNKSTDEVTERVDITVVER